MLLHCQLSSYLLLFISLFVAISIAVPINKQAPFQYSSLGAIKETPIKKPAIERIPSASYIEKYNSIATLDEYYHTIVKQVVESTVDEVLETAPETFLTIHELQFIGRDYCRTSAHVFIEVLEKELNHQVKNSLLVSIRPLIEDLYDQGLTMLELNTLMSQQLGLILNPRQVANNIMNRIYHQQQRGAENTNVFIKYFRLYFDKKWAQTMHHEKNEFIALEAWLRSWLMDIEFLLKDEFDTKISADLL